MSKDCDCYRCLVEPDDGRAEDCLRETPEALAKIAHRAALRAVPSEPESCLSRLRPRLPGELSPGGIMNILKRIYSDHVWHGQYRNVLTLKETMHYMMRRERWYGSWRLADDYAAYSAAEYAAAKRIGGLEVGHPLSEMMYRNTPFLALMR